MDRVDKIKLIEGVEGLDIDEDLRVWEHYWYIDTEEAVLYMTEEMWTNYTEAYNAGITRLPLYPRRYNKDQIYTYVINTNDEDKVFLISLHNDKNIGYTLLE